MGTAALGCPAGQSPAACWDRARFSNWKNHDSCLEAFQRLISDLKASDRDRSDVATGFKLHYAEVMKTVVYRWRVSSKGKSELEAVARREGISLSASLNRITGEWLAARRATRACDEAEEAVIRKCVVKTVRSIAGGDPTRARRASELVREIIYEKHVKESNALARRFGRRADGKRLISDLKASDSKPK